MKELGTGINEVGKKQQPENEPQPTIVIIDDVAQTDEKERQNMVRTGKGMAEKEHQVQGQ